MDHHYGNGLIRQRSGMWRSLREDGDYEEEDVWDVLRERTDESGSSSIPIPRKKLSSAATSSKTIPTRAYTFSSSDSSQSAPVDIPDWSKIVRKRSDPKKPSKTNANPWLEDDDDDDDDEDEDEDEDDGAASDGEGNGNYKAPPHEIIARRMARSHVSSFSVFEGAGRTLKGRDLEKVRNAVLTRTGFLESL